MTERSDAFPFPFPFSKYCVKVDEDEEVPLNERTELFKTLPDGTVYKQVDLPNPGERA